jgi:hypothetical protein
MHRGGLGALMYPHVMTCGWIKTLFVVSECGPFLCCNLLRKYFCRCPQQQIHSIRLLSNGARCPD